MNKQMPPFPYLFQEIMKSLQVETSPTASFGSAKKIQRLTTGQLSSSTQRREKDISPSQIRPESSDWELTRDTLPIFTSMLRKPLPPAKSASYQSQPVLFSNLAADTGSAVWPVKHRHNGVFDEQYHWSTLSLTRFLSLTQTRTHPQRAVFLFRWQN